MLRALRNALPAILLAGVLLAVFHDKPYTIDDSFFLRQARQVIREPANPSGFEWFWDHRWDRVSRLSPSGAGMAYLLVPATLLGAPEWAAHLTLMLLLALAALAMARLTLRLGATDAESAAASLLLVTAPTVLAMSATAMPDVPALAIGLWGMERLLAFRKRGNAAVGLTAGILLGLSIFTRSHAVMLLPVGALFLWPRRRSLWPSLSRSRSFSAFSHAIPSPGT